MAITWPTKGPSTPSSSSLRKNRFLSYRVFGTCSGAVTKRVGSSMRMRHSESTVPLRKVIEEICPSPVARRLSRNRREPGSSPDWSGCHTIEGLKSAADSSEYSWVKYDADQHAAVFAHRLIGQQVLLDLFKTVQEEVTGLLMAVVELAHHVTEQEVDFRLGERDQPRQDSLDALRVGRLERADDDPAVRWVSARCRCAGPQPAMTVSWPVGDTIHDQGSG